MNISKIFVIFLLAVSVALSGCVGQSGGVNQTGTQSIGTPSGTSGTGVSADWCPAGQTSNYAGGQVNQVWTFTGIESYAFTDGAISVCCMIGETTTQNEHFMTRMCVDRAATHSVQWRARIGQEYVKLFEMYPSGSQTCMKTFDATGAPQSDTCQ